MNANIRDPNQLSKFLLKLLKNDKKKFQPPKKIQTIFQFPLTFTFLLILTLNFSLRLNVVYFWRNPTSKNKLL